MKLIQKIVIGIIGVCCLASCSLIHSDEDDCQPYTPDGDPFAYVSLRITTGHTNSVTKANPTGGEEGDGREEGQAKENQISHVMVFFINADDKGINGDDSSPIVARQYWSKEELTATKENGYLSEIKEVNGLLVQHTYDVLVVANAESNLLENVATLGELRDLTATSLYSSDYDDFVMASANAGDKLVIQLSNSRTNPATTNEIDIERTVARVDYRAKGSKGRTDGIYEVPDESGTKTAEVKILSAMLINTLNSDAPSYLFKHVTKTGESYADGPIIYLGEETATDQGVATNYVIGPLRTSKVATNYDKETYFPYFEHYGYEDLSWEDYFVKESLVSGLTDDYICVGYPKENTNKEGSRNFTTGIVFKARYTPVGLTEGQTFFEWEGKIYPTIEAMMEYYDPAGWKIVDEAQDDWDDITTWSALRTNIIFKLKGGDPAGYRAWLVEQSQGKESDTVITAEERVNLRWIKYCETKLYYRNTDGKVEVDINGKDGSTRKALTRRALFEASGAETFKEGICYYTYWIKHANDNDATNDLTMGKTTGGGLMEYGIVRNNVYKLNVNSISSLGNDVPGDCTINVNVLVENWQPLNRQDINIKPSTN